MTVYVDAAVFKKPNGRKFYCHLFADTLEELHEFAAKIGRKRCWFHKSANGYLHYDLCEVFRKLAVEAGALEIDSKDAVMAKKMNRTIEEYLKNEGWSSHLFLEHAKYSFERLKNVVDFKVGRTVIHATAKETGITVKAYVHHNGRSAEYCTFTDEKGNELETLHYTEKPEGFKFILEVLLAGGFRQSSKSSDA